MMLENLYFRNLHIIGGFPLCDTILGATFQPRTTELPQVGRCIIALSGEIQGVSVKVIFSPNMSQGLNLIKYW